MIYRKQNDFEKFHCIADQCPKSCCIGWEIMIDENSLEKYRNVTGSFADRIHSSVDYRAAAFRRQNARCSMLSEVGLCDLQASLGEDYLCDTCRLYPRHTEEFQNLREYSLSLSCPEVVRMVLAGDYTFGWKETEDDTCDDPAEFEDFDFLIFDQLDYARDKMIEIASDRSLSLQERMQGIAGAAYRLQTFYDAGEILSMGNISCDTSDAPAGTGIALNHNYCMQSLDLLLGMETLETSWTDSILEAKAYWSAHPSDSQEWRAALFPASHLEFAFEKILQSLLFTYFCGAVYDGEIYARAMIAVQSVRLLMLIHAATEDSLASTIYRYSREVEHSDQNINTLISWFEAELL